MILPHAKQAKTRRNLKNSRKARANWLYTHQDVQDLYQVCPNTVRNWRRSGLKSIAAKNRLFLGRDLNEFHKQRRREAKRPSKFPDYFCLCCKLKHSLLQEPFQVVGETRTYV
jgi:helix-turn-helix protein